MSRRWVVAGAMALLATLGGLLWLGQQRGGVATEPVPSTPSPGRDLSSPPTVQRPRGILDRSVVYFTQNATGLPVAVKVVGVGVGATGEEGIASRVRALLKEQARYFEVPGPQDPTRSPTYARNVRLTAVKVEGDQARLDFEVPFDFWDLSGSAAVTHWLQQVVYTASEEPGIRRVLITQNGGKKAVVGREGLVVDRPLAREDVLGYGKPATTGAIQSEETRVATVATWRYSVDEVAPGVARFVVELRPAGNAPDGPWIPAFAARLARNDEPRNPDLAKWVLVLEIARSEERVVGQAPHDALVPVDRSPLRLIRSVPPRLLDNQNDGMRYQLALDDERPWRLTVLQDPVRIVVDVGGHPLAVGANTAVYAPRPGETVDRTFTVSGFARAFEANVPWRVRDDRGEIVARGFTTASIGTSVVWGTYSFPVTLPPGISRNFHLEVFQVSAKDGSEMEVVRIPLRVR